MPICWRLSPIPPPSSVSGQLPLVTISPKFASTLLTLARPRGVTSPPHAISHETRARSGEDGMESRVERRASAFGRARLDCQNRTSHERARRAKKRQHGRCNRRRRRRLPWPHNEGQRANPAEGEREERVASDTRAPRCFLSSGRLPVFLLTYEPFRARKRVNDYGTLSILIHLTGHRRFGRGSILVSLRSIILRHKISRPSTAWIRKKLPLP